VPYAYYMKGMAYFVRHRGPMDWMFNADLSERQTDGLHKSFDAFKQLVARYPDSKYADDARLRMIDLRERLAAFEYSVADYYMRRGAYIGASKRAEFILANYPGTSFVPRALEVLAVAYHRLGMEQLASRASATLRTNYPDYQPKADWSSSADVLPARQASR
ncbi:MAG: outer membrane protein assembly factor BamD, partial [Gammaproteobacteria bacterium]